MVTYHFCIIYHVYVDPLSGLIKTDSSSAKYIDENGNKKSFLRLKAEIDLKNQVILLRRKNKNAQMKFNSITRDGIILDECKGFLIDPYVFKVYK